LTQNSSWSSSSYSYFPLLLQLFPPHPARERRRLHIVNGTLETPNFKAFSLGWVFNIVVAIFHNTKLGFSSHLVVTSLVTYLLAWLLWTLELGGESRFVHANFYFFSMVFFSFCPRWRWPLRTLRLLQLLATLRLTSWWSAKRLQLSQPMLHLQRSPSGPWWWPRMCIRWSAKLWRPWPMHQNKNNVS
jgi:hypothetical protein